VDHNAGGVRTGRRARVVTRILRQGARYQETAGPGLFFSYNANASSLRIVDDVGALVPVDERRWFWGLQDHAREVDVAATLDVQLRVAKDLRLGHCSVERDGPL
jgi:hypothetical protein